MEKKQLIEEAKTVQQSVDWWMKETLLACDEIDDIENSPDMTGEEIEKRFNRLQYLLSKANTEVKTIDKLENNYMAYYKKSYEDNKKNRTPNPRVVRCSKRIVP